MSTTGTATRQVRNENYKNSLTFSGNQDAMVLDALRSLGKAGASLIYDELLRTDKITKLTNITSIRRSINTLHDKLKVIEPVTIWDQKKQCYKAEKVNNTNGTGTETVWRLKPVEARQEGIEFVSSSGSCSKEQEHFTTEGTEHTEDYFKERARAFKN